MVVDSETRRRGCAANLWECFSLIYSPPRSKMRAIVQRVTGASVSGDEIIEHVGKANLSFKS